MANSQSSRLTRAFRISRIIIHTLYGFFISIFILPRVNQRRRDMIISQWCGALLATMNIKVIVRGTPPDFSCKKTLFVGNHISWADIHALNSVRTVRFIAKAEIREWPVFGYFAQIVNTLFIDRDRRHEAGRLVEQTTASLMAGDCLCFFPEGTTTDGTHIKPFKSSLLQAAINADADIWPFSVHYPKHDGSANIEMAYYDDVTLMESIQLVLAQRAPVVELHFSKPIRAANYDRRSLSLLARQSITSNLNLAG